MMGHRWIAILLILVALLVPLASAQEQNSPLSEEQYALELFTQTQAIVQSTVRFLAVMDADGPESIWDRLEQVHEEFSVWQSAQERLSAITPPPRYARS